MLLLRTMAFELPKSMNDCLYFTRRSLENGGSIIAWVERRDCTACNKAKMGKPVGKDGKIKIRATEYVCPACGYTEEKKVHEEAATVKVLYTCPHCSHKGEATTPYKRKKFGGVDAYVFACGKCNEKIGVTKKMAEKKKKK